MPCNLHYESICDTYGLFNTPLQHVGHAKILRSETTLRFPANLQCRFQTKNLDFIKGTVKRLEVLMKLNEGYAEELHTRHPDPDFRMRSYLDRFLYQYYQYSLCVQGIEAVKGIISEIVYLQPKISAVILNRMEMAKTIMRYDHPTWEHLPEEAQFLEDLESQIALIDLRYSSIKEKVETIGSICWSGIVHKANLELTGLESKIVSELSIHSKVDISLLSPVQVCQRSKYTILGFLGVGNDLERILRVSTNTRERSMGRVLAMTSWQSNQVLEALDPCFIDRTIEDPYWWNVKREYVEPDILIGLGDNGVHLCRT